MNFRLIIILISIFIFSNCALLFYNTNTFDIYESEHFTFFYLRDSECGDKIKEIASASEFAINIAEIVMNKEIELKIDAYLYDNSKHVAYSKLMNNITDDVTFQFRDGFQIVYDIFKDDFFLYIATILHETIHFFQTSILELKNYGVSEGQAYYIQLKYYYYMKYNDISDDFILSELKYFIYDSVVKDKEMPNKIFSMSGKDFQNLIIDQDGIKRDAKKRYEIGTSFIAFLNKKYGTNKLMAWLQNLDSNNFIEKFNEVYQIDFFTVENLWLIEVIYK